MTAILRASRAQIAFALRLPRLLPPAEDGWIG